MSNVKSSLSGRVPPYIQGMAWMFVTTLMIVSMHTFIRRLSLELHPFEVAFFRNLFGTPILVILLMRSGWGLFRTERVRIHFARSFGHVVAMMMFFVAISITPLATANALAFTAPLFAAVLAMVFLGEVFRWRRWGALAIGFAGTLVILRPGIIEVGTGPLLILAASSLWGIILVVMKALGRNDPPSTMVAYMVVFMTPLSLIPALFHWQWPNLEQLVQLAAMGLVGTAGHLTLTQALRLADTAVVVPVDFFKLVWAALFGYLFFAELPDIFTWVGGIMIFAGATYLAVGERSEGRAVSAQRTASAGD